VEGEVDGWVEADPARQVETADRQAAKTLTVKGRAPAKIEK